MIRRVISLSCVQRYSTVQAGAYAICRCACATGSCVTRSLVMFDYPEEMSFEQTSKGSNRTLLKFRMCSPSYLCRGRRLLRSAQAVHRIYPPYVVDVIPTRLSGIWREWMSRWQE